MSLLPDDIETDGTLSAMDAARVNLNCILQAIVISKEIKIGF